MEAGLAVTEGTVADAVAMYAQIPEFDQEASPTPAEFERRLCGASALTLIAHVNGEPAGFKAGYDRFRDGSWYSWLGGVVPAFRGRGVARALLQAQEQWAAARGFRRLYVKTRNPYREMRIMLVRAGYDVVGVAAPSGGVARTAADLRLMHVKSLV